MGKLKSLLTEYDDFFYLNPELEKINKYLKEKREAPNRRHAGIVLIEENFMSFEYQNLIAMTIKRLSTLFSKGRQVPGEVGKTPPLLTTVSTNIGRNVLLLREGRGQKPLEDFRWWDHVKIGDVMLEAFYQLGYINIERSGNAYRSPYIVYPTGTWLDLVTNYQPVDKVFLGNTSIDTPIEYIKGITQKNHRSVIKGWDGTTNRYFQDELLNTPFIRAIDNIQQTGWKINERVLKVLRDHEDTFVKSEDPLRHLSQQVEYRTILKKAEALNGSPFYQYVECDYRGRIYYSEAFLNFQGSDLARGMMKFSERKQVTDEGLRWLAIHTATCYNQSYSIDEIPGWCTEDYRTALEEEGLESISVDKMTLWDRETWTYEHMDHLINHTDGLDEDAEKPVSFLACCLEWEEWHYMDLLGYPFYSNLPIPVDGTNNGWQHLAAMSKDAEAGALVAVLPSEIPKDFYVATAKELYQLTEGRNRDLLNSMPMKDIRKGISKRGSMTRAYSAGAKTMAENMFADCHQEDYTTTYGITEEDCYSLSPLLIKAINKVCPGPLETMKFLQSMVHPALEEQDTEEKPITWTTPSGFPVKYFAPQVNDVKCRSSIKGIGQIKHVGREVNPKFADIRRYMSGISPNFVHSMDAAHMALVAQVWKGPFGAVHDSFSTHASDVDELLEKTRIWFAIMYDHDDFFEEIKRMILVDPSIDLDKPELGNMEVDNVYYSDYFFS